MDHVLRKMKSPILFNMTLFRFALDAKNNLCGTLVSGVLEHEKKILEKALG